MSSEPRDPAAAPTVPAPVVPALTASELIAPALASTAFAAAAPGAAAAGATTTTAAPSATTPTAAAPGFTAPAAASPGATTTPGVTAPAAAAVTTTPGATTAAAATTPGVTTSAASPGAATLAAAVTTTPAAAAPAGTGQAPTIYDVARAAGVSIASVSRVLNGQQNPRQETRDRVLRAVAELGFVPDGAARALSVRLKEVVGVVVRRPRWDDTSLFADEDENLQFPDMINRGMEIVAQRHGFDLLIRSVGLDEPDAGRRVFALARKSDGLILHDRVLSPTELDRLAWQVPVVTLAGEPTPATVNVHGDNEGGMRALARHLIHDHGYRTIGYLAGHDGSPDSLSRAKALTEEATAAGVRLLQGEQWRGSYQAAGGAQAMERLIASGIELPRVIVCANDQSAIGVLHVLAAHGISVPNDVAVTGFDDMPVARHLRPQLTSVRQSIQDLGATAFETLYSMIDRAGPAASTPRGRDIALPTRLMLRESCGCDPQQVPARWQAAPADEPAAGEPQPADKPQAADEPRSEED
ncbi:MAG TPA: LacI family DNA-binding transcriptional regulator [Streptosporangiaceae bacterium]|nr:LacI family DNA-binding transcriptional regulator [Streptosporangiaceae bacterium]